MKKLCLVVSILIFLNACAKEKVIDEGSVSIKDKISLIVGQEEIISPAFSNDVAKSKEYNWTSSNPGIARVEFLENNTYRVIALSGGNCVLRIEAKDGSISTSCSIEVETGAIVFTETRATIGVGKTLTLDPEFSDEYLRTKNYNYTNLHPDVADIIINEDRTISITGKKIGTTEILVSSEDSTVSATCSISVILSDVKKWVAIGNSITKHGTTSFWWGDWGMAATAREKDYVHVLNSLLEADYNKTISFKAINIASWESDFKKFDKNTLRQYFAGDEDIIIIRLGDNVPINEATYAIYKDELSSLVDFLKGMSPGATYVITGNFWTSNRKDAIQKEVAEAYNCLWVPLSQFDTWENKSSLQTKVWGNDGLWHTISEGGTVAGGVASHPGDLGMKNIATAIYNAIKGL